MRPMTLAGLALVVCGVCGLLSTHVVGLAHASRPADKDVILAVSSGNQLRLVTSERQTTGAQAPVGQSRLLVCQRVVKAAMLSIGYRCQ